MGKETQVGALTPERTEEILQDYRTEPLATRNRLVHHALSRHSVAGVSYVPESIHDLQPHFSAEIKTMGACNQKASGRCWIFAGLNLLREKIAKELDLDKFELSQNYLALYDKIEKANYALESVLSLAERNPMEDRLFRFILENPVNDGGQWDMFVNLVLKYGLMPSESFPETYQSSNTRETDVLVNAAIRRFGYLAHGLVAEGKKEEARALKEETMEKIYHLFLNAFGIPPRKFSFQYTDRKKNVHREEGTPLEFFERHIGKDYLLSLQSLIHSPTKDKPYLRNYTVDWLGNVLEGRPINHLNLPMDRIESLIVESLRKGEPVWFGSDVSFYRDRASYCWNDKAFDYETPFGFPIEFEKGGMLDFAQSAMNHAMLIVGVDLDEEGKPRKWKIENSWGTDNGIAGYYVMSESWFSKFVYQAVVSKELLSEEERKAAEGEPVRLNPWDPMGTLAD